MRQIAEKKFIKHNFLLNSKEAEILYYEYAKDMPIIDYHNHLSAKQIAENKPIENITKAWLSGDHYKWRGMRANGIDEEFITGSASLEKRFQKWAETVPHTLRNPLFHWTQLELKRYFDIDEILQSSSAEEIYTKANAVLATKTPAQLLEDMNVEIICTTDDPTDDLLCHKKIVEAGFYTKVYPTFRSDELFFIGQNKFLNYLKKLAAAVAFPIHNYADFLKAIDSRIDYFHENGCRLSDFGVGGEISKEDFTIDEITVIFDKNLKGETLLPVEIMKYRSSLMLYLGKKYHEKDWVQQYHLGAIRNNNCRLQEQLGSDAGCDSIGDYSIAEAMSKFFNILDSDKKLAKTITYNLNPADNEVFATMMGNFNSSGIPGKMQWGSAWWFLDQKNGMEKQLNTLSNMGLLSRFVGMLTDSRSFLSFPRHEYFRRILCNLIANDVNNGLLPYDLDFLGRMIQDICYYNAKEYFNFK
ncbi:glucuronate isomerase [Lutibacter sp. HS1-25]|uniref:glucuronate isomerase n=1 Tax=Lutibacter sp. HS1-25 TaxID=2485000 RepID=UPI001010F5F6|nr:glucuronate isomerase [Lutibacter sp. HS1-25]RXP55106.1 glucuronate isomerase [Lutibacter sp. HS1-25]